MQRQSLSPSLRRTLLLAAIALTSQVGVAAAQLPGTLFGVVQDENGNPVPNAELVLTDPESPDFRHAESADGKGKYRLFVANATKPYTLTITKAGHQPLTLNGVKISARQRTRRNFTLRTASAAAEAGAAQTASSSGGGAAGLFNRGVAAMNAGDLDSAESMFNQALEQSPGLTSANAGLARLYLQQKKYADAAQHAELAAAGGTDAAAMQQVLYQSYTELGEKKKAKAVLDKMQAANPNTANKNLFNEAADLYNQGDLAGAKPLLEQVLGSDPNHAKANYILGMIYVGEQVNDKARTHLEKFIEVAPNDPEAAVAKEMLSYLQ